MCLEKKILLSFMCVQQTYFTQYDFHFLKSVSVSKLLLRVNVLIIAEKNTNAIIIYNTQALRMFSVICNNVCKNKTMYLI